MNDIQGPADDFVRAFGSAFAHLQVEVREACRSHQEWPQKVAAGFHAALDFVAQEPASARVLLLDALIERPHGFRRYVRLIEHFADLLGTEATHLPPSTRQALVAAIVVIAAAHLRAGKLTELVAAGPELVELILLPYLAAGEAKRWAAETAPSA
jgi:hypothetical protein